LQKKGSRKGSEINRARRSRQVLALAALICLVACIVLAVHWPALSAKALSFDDAQYLTKNKLVQNPSWDSARRFLTEVLEPSTVKGYYQPLSMISLMLDVAMGGSADNLRPFHLTSLLLHVANTSLVIVLLYALFGQVWPAAMVGLLFGVHPLTVEPIPWIGERKTLLAAFFGLWSMVIYVWYTRKQNRQLLLACGLTYVLALMAKPTTTPLPLLFLLFDFWPLKRLSRRSAVEKLPLFLVMVVSSLITVISQSQTASAQMPSERNIIQVLLILCHNIIFYPLKIIWPVNLSSHYPIPRPIALSDPMILAGVIGTCVLLGLLLVSVRRVRAPLTCWLFFFVAIFPTMGVVGFTDVIASDKFAYLPSVGLLILLACLLGQVWKSIDGPAALRIVITILIAVLVTGESVGTRGYLQKWRDTETLHRHMLALAPRAGVLHNGLGNALNEQGRTREAISYFRTAVKLEPKHYGLRTNLALALHRNGKSDEAMEHFYRVVELNKDYAAGHKNLGIALLQRDNFAEAAEHLSIAIDLRPNDANLHYNLAVALARQHLFKQAVHEFRRTLQIDPNHPYARTALQAESKKLEKPGNQ
jgi:Tfp pilus assembly protein PilF